MYHLEDAFIQRNLQKRVIAEMKTTKYMSVVTSLVSLTQYIASFFLNNKYTELNVDRKESYLFFYNNLKENK